MPTETQIIQQPLLAVGIMTAIPVVMFALWADYFGRYLAELREAEPGFDRAMQLGRVRLAGLYAWAVELIIFLAATDLRRQLPAWVNLLFVGALVVQSYLQWDLERKIRGVEITLGEQLRVSARFFMWIAGAIAIYFAAAIGMSVGISVAAEKAGLDGGALIAVKAAAQFLGIFGALLLTFALSPLYVRRFLPVTRLQDGEVRSLVEECFTRAGARVPDVWVIDLGRVKWSNVLVAGFAGGRGPFRPGLFFTGNVLTTLERDELRAVLLHEASHFALHHLRKRLLLGFGALLAGFACVIALGVVAWIWLDPASAKAVLVVGFLTTLFLPFFAIKRQIRSQELEADANAVVRLEAGLEPFASALRKLDQVNDVSSEKKSPDTLINPASGHPATEVRILLLRKALQDARKVRPLHSDTDSGTDEPTDRAA